jgi:acyl-CoA synthetase (AMP-forming)/AMP-acid ligase II
MKLAIANGAPMPPLTMGPASLLAGIQQRLDAMPHALLWELDGEGRPVATAYRDIWSRAIHVRAGLVDAGIAPGTVLAGGVQNAADIVVLFWACLMGGYGFLPLSGRTRRAARDGDASTLTHLLAMVPGARWVADDVTAALGREVCGTDVLELKTLARAGGAPWQPPLCVADPLCYLPTSGSTGRDKLACFKAETLLRRRFIRADAGGGATGGSLWTFDLDSVTGFNAVFVGASDWGILAPDSVLRRPCAVFEMIAATRAARLCLTNALALRLIDSAIESAPEETVWDLSSLQRVALGGEPVTPQVARRLAAELRARGADAVRLRAGYGTTETGSLTTGDFIDLEGTASIPPSLGQPAVGVRLRIVGEGGEVLPEGEAGAVEAHCPELLFNGYAGGTSAGEACAPEGWWRTGDRGWLVAGALHLQGRDKALVIVRGRKLALPDLEEHLARVAGPRHEGYACAIDGADGESLGVALVGTPDAKVAAAVRRTLGRTFGVQPTHLAFIPRPDLPLAAGGKLQRRRLAEMLAAAPPFPIGAHDAVLANTRPSSIVAESIVTLWRDSLPPGADIAPDAHFFEQGGDSLRLQALLAEAEARFDVELHAPAFLADPSLRHLERLLVEIARQAPASIPDSSRRKWPLPPALDAALRGALADWPNRSPDQDILRSSFNVAGGKPPLFWVFQAPWEAAALAAALGPEQPLYGFRSGHGIYGYDADTVHAVGLRYVEEILEISATGPLFVGGNCQGGRVAFEIASLLERRRLEVPLLVLMEWGFELFPYAGSVLFLHGPESLEGNPWLRHASPERVWQRHLRDWQVATIAGQHGQYFRPAYIGSLATTLEQHFASAMHAPPRGLPLALRRANVRLAPPSHALAPGQRTHLMVEVSNDSPAVWPAGLSLGNYWRDAHGHVRRWCDGRIPLPPLHPGASLRYELPVQAPDVAGAWLCVVDVVEEGGVWFDRSRQRAGLWEVDVR